MASTPKGIVYPTSGDNIAPLETHFASLASTADDAIEELETQVEALETELDDYKDEVGKIPQTGTYAFTGSTSTTSPTELEITFPSGGYFSVAPTVVATVSGANNSGAYLPTLHDVTADKFEVRVWRLTGNLVLPSVVSTSSSDFGNSTTGTMALPPGLQENDRVVVVVGSDGSQPGTSSTGWTTIASTTTRTAFLTIFSKVMGPTVDSSIILSGLSTASTGVATAYRNTGTITASTVADGGSGMPNPPSVTTTENNSFVVAVGGIDDDNVVSVTAPTGYGSLISRAASTTGFTTMMASKRVDATGVEDPEEFGGSGSDDWTAFTLTINPPAVNSESLNLHWIAK